MHPAGARLPVRAAVDVDPSASSSHDEGDGDTAREAGCPASDRLARRLLELEVCEEIPVSKSHVRHLLNTCRGLDRSGAERGPSAGPRHPVRLSRRRRRFGGSIASRPAVIASHRATTGQGFTWNREGVVGLRHSGTGPAARRVTGGDFALVPSMDHRQGGRLTRWCRRVHYGGAAGLSRDSAHLTRDRSRVFCFRSGLILCRHTSSHLSRARRRCDPNTSPDALRLARPRPVCQQLDRITHSCPVLI
jgi:hypothetical protein